jgi:hypothetical protein
MLRTLRILFKWDSQWCKNYIIYFLINTIILKRIDDSYVYVCLRIVLQIMISLQVTNWQYHCVFYVKLIIIKVLSDWAST